MESPVRRPSGDDLRLIETFGWQPGHGALRLDRHLERMRRSAAELGFAFDRDRALETVAGLEAPVPQRCRLTLGRDGGMELTLTPLGETPGQWRVMVAQTRLDPNDPWLRHKTTRRALYDRTRAALPGGIDEALFVNSRGELCEGTISNLFLTRQDGRVLTPALSCGVLPGVLRQEMLERGAAQEAVLTLEDLRCARALHLGNALRGLIAARLVDG